jgi:hypothetical protein
MTLEKIFEAENPIKVEFPAASKKKNVAPYLKKL